MTLKEKIHQYKQQSAGKVPADLIPTIQRGTADVQASLASRAIPSVGDQLPSFELADSSGTIVSSDRLLESGPLIVTFFRGMW
jgi:hypothetical protein